MKPQGWLVPTLFAVVVLGAVAYVIWPDAKPPTVSADPPRPAQPALVPSPAADVTPASPEPEEGSSPRRVTWTEVTVDAMPSTPEKLARAGVEVYKQHCLVCHGEKGLGNGPAAGVLTTPPRNFSRGYFKFKTSGQGEMPLDEDIYRTISSGIPAAGMPSFGDLTPFERWALVAQVKVLSELEPGWNHFEKRPPKGKIAFAPAPASFNAARGAEVFKAVGCTKCHGEKGLGDGPSAADLVDALDQPIRVPDISRGEVTFKAGSQAADIFRVLTTGMAGTPMPAFTNNISDEDRWHLAHFVTTLYRPIDPGERVFLKVGCTSCHTVGGGKLIGPDLAGVMQRRDRAWMKKWLKDPPTMLATDATARKLLEEFLTPMPSYGLTDREIDRLIKFMETFPPAPPAAPPK